MAKDDCKMRKASPPPEIEEEAERLLDEWASTDTPLSFEQYLSQKASEKVKEYMAKVADVDDEEE